MQDVIRMTYDVALCHPDEITKIWSLSHPDDLAIPSISSGWLIVDALCHPDDLPGVGISSGWVTANSLCHPDDILFHFMSPRWLNWGWFLIRMSYDNIIMSSGWDMLPFLSHPDEIANFDFPQDAVALQRFCSDETRPWGLRLYNSFLRGSPKCALHAGHAPLGPLSLNVIDQLKRSFVVAGICAGNRTHVTRCMQVTHCTHCTQVTHCTHCTQVYGSAEGPPRGVENRNLLSHPDDLRMEVYVIRMT